MTFRVFKNDQNSNNKSCLFYTIFVCVVLFWCFLPLFLVAVLVQVLFVNSVGHKLNQTSKAERHSDNTPAMGIIIPNVGVLSDSD